MKAAVLVLLVAPVFAQDGVSRGERLFSTTCSIPYCHGANGTLGRAPKLAGHKFTSRELTNIVSNGVANTAMPSFKGQLSPEDLNVVIDYVMTLRDPSAPAGNSRTAVRPSAPEPPGKALFFDAVRMGGCGRCHELQGRGSPVAEIKAARNDLTSITAAHVVTATPEGEPSFAGFVLEQSEKRVRVYDLSSQLPTLRTFRPADVQVAARSSWTHRDAIRGYTNDELRAVAAYLQSAMPK
jgi:cytochrome c553